MTRMLARRPIQLVCDSIDDIPASALDSRLPASIHCTCVCCGYVCWSFGLVTLFWAACQRVLKPRDRMRSTAAGSPPLPPMLLTMRHPISPDMVAWCGTRHPDSLRRPPVCRGRWREP